MSDKKKDKKKGKDGEEEEDKIELPWNADADDPLTRERGKCLNQDHHVKSTFKELEECTRRVKGKSYTAETCHQEMKDLVVALDHCVGSKAFLYLK